MRISAKGRYALCATVSLAQSYRSGEYITVLSISERLGISKIYLEQVFSLLKRGGIVSSIKGAQGGYQLSRPPEAILIYDILAAVETSLFEDNDETVTDSAPHIEAAVRELVYRRLDDALKKTLQETSLQDLVTEAEKNDPTETYMYYI